MATHPNEISLSPEQREILAALEDQTGKTHHELIDEWLASAPLSGHSPSSETKQNLEKSLYDVLSERGMLGCFDGPTDLATNPKHMEGFGRNAKSSAD